ncbi:twin-arginine translocase TatA/TatE family subunit [candidate division KSB1 bacterium]
MSNILPLFFDISSGELIIIVAAIFIVFGPKKIPEIARKFGKGINEIKKASNDIKEEIKSGFENNVKKEVENIIENDLKIDDDKNSKKDL